MSPIGLQLRIAPCLVFALAGGTAGQDQPAPPLGPVLEAHPAEVIFEEVYGGQSADREIRLTNVGDQLLLIDKAKGSCGCTATLLGKKRLEPGESTVLTATFTASRGQAGRTVRKRITITSNDPTNGGTLTLPLSATVVVAVTVQPASVALAELEPATPVSREVTLTATDGRPFQITGTKIRGPGVRVSGVTDEENPTHRLTIEVTPPDDHTSFGGAGRILVETTHPRDAKIDIPVSWRMLERVMVRPRSVVLGRCEPSQVVERTLTITSKEHDRLDDLSFSLEGADLEVTAARNPRLKDAWDLRFTIPEAPVRRYLRATLLVDTHVQPEGIVKVPVSGLISERKDPPPDSP